MIARAVRPVSTRTKALASGLLVALAALVLTITTVPGANGAFIAKITNDTDTAATNPYFTCAAAAADQTNLKPYLVYALNSPLAAGVVADSSGNGRTGTYGTTGLSTATDATVCPRDTPNTVTTFTGNGTTNGNALAPGGGYVLGPATAIAGPNTFSVAAWFKTTTKGGMIIGFGNSNTAASSGNYDRHLYIGADGLLYFGVYNGTTSATYTANSATSVADNAWHYAVGTFSPNSLMLYLDGKQVGTTNTGTAIAQNFSGYWRIGYDNLNAWPDVPNNFYFNGSMAWAGVYSTALTYTQVAQLYAAGH